MRSEYPENKTLQSMYSFIYVFQLLSAILCGFGGSILWVAQGKYISQCANDSNKGLYNAVFWAFLMTALVVGNALGAFVIARFKASVFFILLTGVCLVAALFLLVLPKPVTSDSAKAEEPKTSICEAIKQTWSLMISPRMLTFLPILIYSAMSMAIYASLLTPLLARTMPGTLSEDKKTSAACVAMIFLGAGEIVGSFANGKLHDLIGSKLFAIANLIQLCIAYALIVYFNHRNKYNYGFAMTLCFAWGVMDAGLTNFFRGILGFQFDSQTIPFSVLTVVQSFSMFVMVYLGALVKTVTAYWIYLGCTFGFAVFAWLLFFFRFELRTSKKGAITAE